MAKRFDFSAQVVLAAPTNIKPVVNSIQQSLNSITANINLKVSPGAQQSINGLNSSFQTFNTTLNTTYANIRNVSNALNGLKISIGNVGLSRVNDHFSQGTKLAAQQKVQITTLKQEMEEYGRVAGFALRKFSAWMIGSSLILAPLSMLKEATKSAVTFQDHMVKLSQLTGGSVTSTYKDLGDEITRLSTTLGVSSDKLLDVSNKLVQAGLSTRDTQVVMEALAKTLNAPAFDNINNTMEGTIALMHQFNIGADGVNGALSSMHALAAATAVESSDLIDAIRIAGGTFATMSKGVVTGSEALNQFMALFTSVRATTRENAESIATALKTIFARLERPQNISSLKQLGVDVLDAKGRFIGAYEAIEKISEAVKKIPAGDIRLFQLGEDLGGYRQIGRLLPLLFQAEERQKALNIAKSGTAQLDEVNKRAQESWAVQITKVHERFLALIRDLSKTDAFKSMMTTILGLANSFITLADSMKSILPYFAIIGGFKLAGAISQMIPGFVPALLGKSKPIAKASGGPIPGAGDEDNVPAMLTPGEFVINKRAAQQIGRNNLERLNSGILHFQTGGNVPRSPLTGRFMKGGKREYEEGIVLGGNTTVHSTGNIILPGAEAPKISGTPNIILGSGTPPPINAGKPIITSTTTSPTINSGPLYTPPEYPKKDMPYLRAEGLGPRYAPISRGQQGILFDTQGVGGGTQQMMLPLSTNIPSLTQRDILSKRIIEQSQRASEYRERLIRSNEEKVSKGYKPSFKLNPQPFEQKMASQLADEGVYYEPGGKPIEQTFFEKRMPTFNSAINRTPSSVKRLGGSLMRGGGKLIQNPSALMLGGVVAEQLGGETPTGSAIGQGLGMAGMGAYAGGLIGGPIGSLVGAAAMGTYGAVSGYGQKTAQIEQDRLSKTRMSAEQQLVRSTEAVTHAFNQLEQGGSVSDFIKTLDAVKLNIANVEKSTVEEKRKEANLGNIKFTSPTQEGFAQEYYKLGGGRAKVENKGDYNRLSGGFSVALNALFGTKISDNAVWSPGTGPAEKYKLRQQATQNKMAEELSTLQGPATAVKSFFDNLLEQKGMTAEKIAANPDYSSAVSMYSRYYGATNDRWGIYEERGKQKSDPEKVRQLEQQAFINSRKVIDETTLKFKNLSNELAKSEAAFAKMSLETEKTIAKLEGIGNIGAQSRNLLQSTLSGGTSAAGIIPISNMFANPMAYSSDKLRVASESLIGGSTLGTRSISSVKNLKESEADITAKIMELSGETNESTQNAILKVFEPYFKTLPENLRRQATKGIEKEFLSKQQNEQVYTGQNFVEKGGVSSVIEGLEKKIEPQLKLSLETVNKINEAMERRNTLIKQEHAQILKINELTVRKSEFEATQPFALQSILKPGVPLSIGETTAGVTARRTELGKQFGLKGGQFENIGAIENRMGELRSRAEQYNQQIGKTQSQLVEKPGDQDLIGKLTEANNGLNGVLREIASGNQLINDLKTDSTKQTAILGELNSLQKRREEGQKTVMDIATMSPDEQLKTTRQLSAFEKFQQTGQMPFTLQGKRDVRAGFEFIQRSGGFEPGKAEEIQTGMVRGLFGNVGFKPAAGGWGERNILGPGQDKRSGELIGQFRQGQNLQRGAMGLEINMAQIDQTQIAKNVEIIAHEIQRTLQVAGGDKIIPTAKSSFNPLDMFGGIASGAAKFSSPAIQAIKNLPFVSNLFGSEEKKPNVVNPRGTVPTIKLPERTFLPNIMGEAGAGQPQNLSVFDKFANSVDKLAQLNIPSSIELIGNLTHTHNVVGTDSIGKAVVEEVKGYIESYLAEQLGKVVNPNTGETNAFQPAAPLKGIV